jgi:hypothetical protein
MRHIGHIAHVSQQKARAPTLRRAPALERFGFAPLTPCPLRVFIGSREVENNTRLIPHYLSIVAWGYHDCLTGTELLLGTVIHGYTHSPRDYVAYVRYLTAIRSRNRLYVFRPPPSWFENSPPYSNVAQFDYVHLPMVERARLVWGV